jgi:hypothetical protein
VATLANIHHEIAFEPGALAPISDRFPGRRRTSKVPADWVAASPIAALVAQFPVIHGLVGDDSFRAMARRFTASEPERSSSSAHCGETFPRFLRSLSRVASIEYIADIAELELAWTEARYAAEASPVDAKAISSAWRKKRGDTRVVLHPSVVLVASRFPIVTIWQSNQLHGETAMIDRWRAECALVARPFDEVEVHNLSRGGYAFVSALAERHTIAVAIDAGRSAAPDFDIRSNLAMLAEANVVVGIRNKEAVS